MRREGRLRRAIGITAALLLVIQVLSIGTEVTPPAPPRPTVAASHQHIHDGHHVPAPPEQQHQAAHCSWCILCGKLGAAVGAPPVPIVALGPVATRGEHVSDAQGACVLGRFYAVLPLGSRAPPGFV
jgi:hypothetical protein